MVFHCNVGIRKALRCCQPDTEDTIRQLIKTGWNTKKHPGFQNFAVFCPLALFVGPGSAAGIVRTGIWWWLAVMGGDNCHSGGPVQHPGFVGLAPGETQSVAALERACCLLVLNSVTSTPQWIHTSDGQCSHYWSVGFLLTWINVLF
jgi:hypothetical protein